ncbi:uncharacterized protein A4U43_C08F11690 [Asparagus officinalis]|nr:uncharacterized protein A4U43_C08F11690 [Asparagus officinalis]
MSTSSSPRPEMLLDRGVEIKRLQQRVNPSEVHLTAQLNWRGSLIEVPYSRALVNRRNHFGHDGIHELEVTHVFDLSVPLFLDGISQEKIEAIRMGSYKTLWEIITDAKFSVHHEDVSVKPHFLFEDSVPH